MIMFCISMLIQKHTKTNRIFAGWVSPIMAMRPYFGAFALGGMMAILRCTCASRSSLVSIQPSRQTLVPKEPQQ